MNITESFESINMIMKRCIEKEITPGGLLEDVNTFVSAYTHDSIVDEPVIWMTQHPTTADRQADISHTMTLRTPFEFDCAVYHPDIERAEWDSQNLTTRVILAITKNYLCVQKELFNKRVISNILLETYSPVGNVQITGKSDRLPVTGVVLNAIHTVNWTRCCKEASPVHEEKQKENEGD